MSMSSEEAYDQETIAKVIEMAVEPSYVSEIARKLEVVDDGWGLTGTRSVERVAIIVSMLDEREAFVTANVGYDGIEDAQEKSSPMESLTDEVGEGEPEDRWNPYTLVHYTSDTDVRDEFSDHVDNTVTIEEKAGIIENLSGSGNRVSVMAEEIMQDCLSRQFKHYDNTETPDYNDPGVDFYVEDERNREWGLAVEISVRWVNPIGSKYIDSKKEKALDNDADLLVLAPKFRQNIMEKYNGGGSGGMSDDPMSSVVNISVLPSMEPDVYQPFAKSPEDVNDREPGGNPVIVPDPDPVRDRLNTTGNVGGSYPVADSDMGSFTDDLDYVFREHTVVTESQYRNEIRESIEPLLWEFLRPYKIEQFLQDMYWDKDLTQSEIGSLVDRSGGTIGDWMRRWGVIRRGTGAPELSDGVLDVWKRMYRGEDPFPKPFSGYRIQAEYNRHPLWSVEDWREWYEDTTEEERKEAMSSQSSSRENIEYTLMMGPTDRLYPSYTFILNTLRNSGVDVRDPDEAPMVPYSAYPSRDTLEFMLNRNQDTIVEVE